MKKIAVFVEGQSELIFFRNYLFKMVDNSRLSFECVELYGERMQKVPHKFSSPNADFYFLIVNVGNDSRVASAIKERADKMILKGFEKVLGIRDMYCQEYYQRSPNIINEDISKQFIEASVKIINNLGNSQKIIIIFSIMELESWFLGMYSLFEKIDIRLSVEFIETELKYNLKDIDPQNIFYRPSKELDRILTLIGLRYDKSFGIVEKITSVMEHEDFINALENGRCRSFYKFNQQIEAIIN